MSTPGSPCVSAALSRGGSAAAIGSAALVGSAIRGDWAARNASGSACEEICTGPLSPTKRATHALGSWLAGVSAVGATSSSATRAGGRAPGGFGATARVGGAAAFAGVGR